MRAFLRVCLVIRDRLHECVGANYARIAGAQAARTDSIRHEAGQPPNVFAPSPPYLSPSATLRASTFREAERGRHGEEEEAGEAGGRIDSQISGGWNGRELPAGNEKQLKTKVSAKMLRLLLEAQNQPAELIGAATTRRTHTHTYSSNSAQHIPTRAHSWRETQMARK